MMSGSARRNEVFRDYTVPMMTDDTISELDLPQVKGCERLDDFRKHEVTPEATVRVNSRSFAPLSYDQFVRDFEPWQKISHRSKSPTWKKHSRPVLNGFWINSIFGHPAWSTSYFHWHRNFLTRLNFLISQGFSDINVIVKDDPPDYELQSLKALGVRSNKMFRFSEVRGKFLENVITVTGIDYHDHSLLYDFVRPSALRAVSKKITDYFEIESVGPKRNIFALRGNGLGRHLSNESDIIHHLEKDGFEAIDIGGLTYKDQVHLFSNVTKLVGVHGAALTNIMFAEKPLLLELTALGHGIRPDFLPFAEAAGGKLTILGFPSENPQNDIFVPKDMVSWWLNQDSPPNHQALISMQNSNNGRMQ